MRVYQVVVLAVLSVLLLFGILNGDVAETWRNGATL